MPASSTKKVRATASRVPVDAPAPLEDRKIIILFQSNTQIDRGMMYGLIDRLGGYCTDDAKQPRVDLWLDSPGGDAHAAYKLALYLRSRFEHVHVVIPDYAKSAATLLALVGESIYMGPSAELGPLDMQQWREGEMSHRSSLDTSQSIEALFRRAVRSALVEGGKVIQDTMLSRENVITHMLEFSANFYRPLIEQLDPRQIYEASAGLEITIQYGIRLLRDNGSADVSDDLGDRVRKLVAGYPSHGFVIDRDEARSLGLPILPLSHYDLRSELETAVRDQSNMDNVIVASLADFNVSKSNSKGASANGKANVIVKSKALNGVKSTP